MTDDAEMKQFMMAIPGSFRTAWGAEVWEKVGNTMEDESEDKSRRDGQNEPAVGPRMDQLFRLLKRCHLSSDDLYTLRLSAASLDQSLTWSGNSLPIIPLPKYVRLMLHTPPHVPKERMLYTSSVHVLLALLETCKNRNLFASDDSWRRRTHACIETTTSLVCCANGGMDQLFVMRWTCLTCG